MAWAIGGGSGIWPAEAILRDVGLSWRERERVELCWEMSYTSRCEGRARSREHRDQKCHTRVPKGDKHIILLLCRFDSVTSPDFVRTWRLCGGGNGCPVVVYLSDGTLRHSPPAISARVSVSLSLEPLHNSF